MATREQYVELARSVKDEKPKPVKRRPSNDKYETRVIVAAKPNIGYETR